MICKIVIIIKSLYGAILWDQSKVKKVSVLYYDIDGILLFELVYLKKKIWVVCITFFFFNTIDMIKFEYMTFVT